MKLRHSVPALALALAVASQPVAAQAHRGGSRAGQGGSHSGNRGYAVARHSSAGARSGAAGSMHYASRPGYAPGRGVAQQRHPRAGTGSGYRYYPGHGYSYGRGAYRPYYGYYRPYYGYRYPYYAYYPYSYYWPGVSLSFGWGYGSSWPYYVGGYYDGPSYSVGPYAPNLAAGVDDDVAPPPPARELEPSYERRSGRVRLEVRPDDVSVYVDNEFRGAAREARFMKLPAGRHVIELVRPGFAIERRELTVVSGESQDVLVELRRP